MTGFFVSHVDGWMESISGEFDLSGLLGELDETDAEHGDVAVSDEEGWTVSVTASRRVIWENVETGDSPRHIDGLDVEQMKDVLSLFLVEGRPALERLPWQDGYGS